jgi:hypothetical protein
MSAQDKHGWEIRPGDRAFIEVEVVDIIPMAGQPIVRVRVPGDLQTPLCVSGKHLSLRGDHADCDP